MARRSPQNDRYRKDAKVGATKRSAASAKPKRELGDSSSSLSGTTGKKGAPAKGRRYLPNPDTPEFRRWNYLNYGLLGVALLAALILLLVQSQFRGTAGPLGIPKETIIVAMWVVWAVALGGSTYIQFAVLRKMRADWEASGRAEAHARALDKERAEKDAAKAAAKKAQTAEAADRAAASSASTAKPAPRPDDVAKLPPLDSGKDA